MALDLLDQVSCFKIRHLSDETIKLRIGIHSGPCAAGSSHFFTDIVTACQQIRPFCKHSSTSHSINNGAFRRPVFSSSVD